MTPPFHHERLVQSHRQLDCDNILEQLVVATTKNVLVYITPADSHTKTNGHGSNVTNTGTTSKKKRHKGKSSAARSTASAELKLLKTVLLPLLSGVQGGTSSFRSARYVSLSV